MATMHTYLATSRALDGGPNPYRLRQGGHIPAIIYGKGFESLALQMESKEVTKLLKSGERICEIQVNEKEKHLVNIKEIQKDFVRDKILHLSFYRIRRDQETTIDVPIRLTGKAKGLKEGASIVQMVKEARISGLPTALPEALELDVTELGVNDSKRLKDIQLPQGVQWKEDDLEKAVAFCTIHKEEAPAAAAPAADAAATAEGAAAAGGATAEGQAPAGQAPAAGAKKEKEKKE